MELFYSNDIDGNVLTLDAEESGHCVKVLRHRQGDQINVIDGEGTLYRCTLLDASAKGASCQIEESIKNWGSHDYHLTMAVCPTKNNDRFEWFAEKGTELGLDVIAPVIGDRSERRVFKTDRLRKILLSATKQSLKASIPQVSEPQSVKEFIKNCPADIKLIAYCFEDDDKKRISIKETLSSASQGSSIAVLIGPEGDFSPEEAKLAIQAGFVPVHLGQSRLRTETAALTAVEAVYIKYM